MFGSAWAESPALGGAEVSFAFTVSTSWFSVARWALVRCVWVDWLGCPYPPPKWVHATVCAPLIVVLVTQVLLLFPLCSVGCVPLSGPSRVHLYFISLFYVLLEFWFSSCNSSIRAISLCKAAWVSLDSCCSAVNSSSNYCYCFFAASRRCSCIFSSPIISVMPRAAKSAASLLLSLF